VTPAWVTDALCTARVARLGTVRDGDAVRLVPICFALVDGGLVSAVDHKPKRTGQLRRLDDITASGSATILVDHYDDDWSQLWWVRVRGHAEVLADDDPATSVALGALVTKYVQYAERPPRGPVYRVALDEVRWWRYADADVPGSAP
jgi:PPOX class probable F420-dependent enzyme